MTRERKVELLRQAAEAGNAHAGSIAHLGMSPREYARLAAAAFRAIISDLPPTTMSMDEAEEFIDEIERGEFDREIAATVFGYM